MRLHDPFQPFEGWQDTAPIKEQVEAAFAEGAGVDVPTLRRALARVTADGYYGPIADDLWEESVGGAMPMARARQIIRHAQEDAELPRVALSHPDLGHECGGVDECMHPDHTDLDEPGPLFHEEPVELSRVELTEWYFGALKSIYGTVYIP